MQSNARGRTRFSHISYRFSTKYIPIRYRVMLVRADAEGNCATLPSCSTADDENSGDHSSRGPDPVVTHLWQFDYSAAYHCRDQRSLGKVKRSTTKRSSLLRTVCLLSVPILMMRREPTHPSPLGRRSAARRPHLQAEVQLALASCQLLPPSGLQQFHLSRVMRRPQMLDIPRPAVRGMHDLNGRRA